MPKLKTHIANKIKYNPHYRRMVALSIGIDEDTVLYHLENNRENGNLTKINALYCIKDLLETESIDELLDKSGDTFTL
jgi:predicted transcriptional regulator